MPALARIPTAVLLLSAISATAAAQMGGPPAFVTCGVLNNAQVPDVQCYQAMLQAYTARVAAYNNMTANMTAELNADRAALYQQCQALGQFAQQLGLDTRNLPPC